MPVIKLIPESQTLRIRGLCFCIALFLFAVALARLWMFYFDRGHYYDLGQAKIAGAGSSMAEQIGAQFRMIDTSLGATIDSMRMHGMLPDIQAEELSEDARTRISAHLRERARTSVPIVREIVILDTNGRFIASSAVKASRLKDGLAAASVASWSGKAISLLPVPSKTNTERLLLYSRLMPSPRPDIRYMAAAIFSASELKPEPPVLLFADGLATSLFDEDSRLVTSWPLKESPEYLKLVEAAAAIPPSMVVAPTGRESISPWQYVEIVDNYLLAVSDVRFFPFFLVSSIDSDVLYAAWHHNMGQSAFVAFAMFLVAAIMTVWFFRGYAFYKERLAAFKLNQERYRELVRNFPTGVIMLVDSSMRCVLADGLGLAGLGLRREDIEGHLPFERMTPEKAQEVERHLRKALDGARVSFTLPLNSRVYEAFFMPIWENGYAGQLDTVKNCVVVLNDITQREQSRQALRESEIRLLEAQRIARLGSFSLDLFLGLATLSPNMRELLGITDLVLEKGASVGEALRRIFTPHVAWPADLLSSLEEGRTEEFQEEFFFSAPGGAPAWALVRGRVERDETGRIVRIQGTFQDITQRREAEQALRRSEARYRILARNIPAGLAFLFDSRLHLLLADGQSLEDFGVTLPVTENAPLADILPKSLAAQLLPLCDAAFEGRTTSIELPVNDLIFEVGIEPLIGEQGMIAQALLVARDISGRKKFEEALLQARDAAEEANRQKSRFIASISHEIRTPITGILGIVDAALSRSAPKRQREYLEKISTVSKTLSSLINDLLDLSRMEAGRLLLQNEPCALQPLIRNALEPLYAIVQKKGLELTIEIEPDLPDTIYADPTRLSQVLLNLAGNAVKFTETGWVRVRVGLLPASAAIIEGNREKRLDALIFHVEDSGPGIRKEAHELIFKTFIQGDGADAHKQPGSGLGLAISRQLVQIWHGQIGVKSEPGRGSLFWFTLPLLAASAESVQAPPSFRPLAEEAPLRLRILLAEDNELIQEFLTLFLEDQGHTVICAYDGREALGFLEQGEMGTTGGFDLVLMDVQMRPMGGLEATKAIRASGASYRNIPIIGLTAYAMTDDQETFLAAGMDEVLTKPVDRADLLSAVRRHGCEGGK